ncbi:MAG TPA: chorismate lyase [Rhodocyclaceae bacterium]|nr:chorismate lyase [Rhodocyclaceae bacterium]
MPLDSWIASPIQANHPLRRWLTDRASLTARIAARCERVTVQLLSQKLAVPHRDEAQLAGLRHGELAWLREVVLHADGRPVVYARSVLARRSLRGAWTMFAGMGTRPLGAALFADPCIARGSLTARRLDARDRRYHRAVTASGVLPGSPQSLRKSSRHTKVLWARRSCFRRKGRSLIVCEIFLDGILSLDR